MEPASPETALAIARYAEKVKSDGFYLSFVDMFLFVEEKEASIRYVIHEEGKLLEPESALLAIQQMLPKEMDIEKHCSAHDPSSPMCWHFLLCKFDFSSDQLCNLQHWVPCFYKDCVGEDTWAACIQMYTSSLEERKLQIEANIIESMQNDAEDKMQDACLEAHLEAQEHLQLEEKTFKGLHSMNLFPVQVPGNGNCGVWSLLACSEGLAFSLSADLETPEAVEACAGVRGETWRVHAVDGHMMDPKGSKGDPVFL